MTVLNQLLAARALRPLDVQAGRLLARLSGGTSPELPVVAAVASWATGQGHTCLPLSALSPHLTEAGLDGSRFTDLAAVRQTLLATPVVGRPDDHCPLILDDRDRLYLLRFYRYEQTIACALRSRAEGIETLAAPRARALLTELFPPAAPSPAAIDWQRTAAALALLKRFVVISGGPGTGKTYTVARILAALAALAPQKLRIGLAAPTGKAALRLQESIRAAQTTLPPKWAGLIADQAQTLHRLLGFRSSPPGFLHNSANPLHLDLLILDEASMIDVPLMAAMLAALPPACRVILLGDRDQLASVEAGNLLSDICGSEDRRWSTALTAHLQPLTGSIYDLARSPAAQSADPLADSIVLLRTSRRFREASGISALSRAVNSGRGEALYTVLDQPYPDLRIEEQTGPNQTAWLQAQLLRFFSPLFKARSASAALQELGKRRILCTLREGPSGVDGINALTETIFRRLGDISAGERCYRGMPMIILRNDYPLGLFNGDTGIVWPDDQGMLQAWFPLAEDAIRPISLARLPPWQSSYAITVHKSQGSEFGEVLLLLPPEDVPILSRELLYTGITRARDALTVYGRKDLLVRAVERRVVRYSGLGDQLRDQREDKEARRH